MKNLFLLFILVSCAVVGTLPAFAQKVDIRADSLDMVTVNGEQVRKLKGNVVLTQPGRTLQSDSAFQYPGKNMTMFRSNVRIVQEDGTTITGDTLYYYGANKVAKMTGNVTLNSGTTSLTTTELDYNLKTSVGYYNKNATMTDPNSTLTSVYGQYNTKTKLMYFTKNVSLVSENNNLRTDTLRYNTVSKIAYFFGPTTINTPDGVLKSTRGEYNTVTEASKFAGRAFVENEGYTITSDTLDYDKLKQYGIARGHVALFTKKDSITILGNEARYSRKRDYAIVYGNSLLKMPTDGDTLYLKADTLHTINTSNKTRRELRAYHAVKVYKSDLQSVCDSLVYTFSDSLIYFYKQPIMWSATSQLTADSIHIQMAHNKIDRMFMRVNPLIVQRDSLKNFNQVKGREMIGYFRESSIYQMNVNGNGQSIYFVTEGDTALIGLNKLDCSNIIIRFGEKSKIKTISFLTKPDALFIPPHEIAEPDKKLKGFVWHEKGRPTLQTVLQTNNNVATEKPVIKKAKFNKKRNKLKNK